MLGQVAYAHTVIFCHLSGVPVRIIPLASLYSSHSLERGSNAGIEPVKSSFLKLLAM